MQPFLEAHLISHVGLQLREEGKEIMQMQVEKHGAEVLWPLKFNAEQKAWLRTKREARTNLEKFKARRKRSISEAMQHLIHAAISGNIHVVRSEAYHVMNLPATSGELNQQVIKAIIEHPEKLVKAVRYLRLASRRTE